MIFITLGSQKFQFNRLLEAADALEDEEPIFAQTGCSDYIPQHYEYRPFLDKTEFDACMDRADIVITHGGTGAIITAVKKGKKVIAVPRLSRYGEHVDDHQLQVIHELQEMNLICECEDMDLRKALDTVRHSEYHSYVSNTETIIRSIESYLLTI